MSTCGHCGRSWDERETPTPSGRCPFEYEHEYPDDLVVIVVPDPYESHIEIMREAYPGDPITGESTVRN